MVIFVTIFLLRSSHKNNLNKINSEGTCYSLNKRWSKIFRRFFTNFLLIANEHKIWFIIRYSMLIYCTNSFFREKKTFFSVIKITGFYQIMVYMSLTQQKIIGF